MCNTEPSIISFVHFSFLLLLFFSIFYMVSVLWSYSPFDALNHTRSYSSTKLTRFIVYQHALDPNSSSGLQAKKKKKNCLDCRPIVGPFAAQFIGKFWHNVVWPFTWFLMASLCSPIIIVNCSLAPHVILLTDSLCFPAVTFNLYCQRWSQDFESGGQNFFFSMNFFFQTMANRKLLRQHTSQYLYRG